MATTNTTDKVDPIDALMEQVRALKASRSAEQRNTKGQKDVSRAISLFKASQAKYNSAQELLTQAIALLEGNDEEKPQSPEYEANVAKFPKAPYDRKTNGLPKFAGGLAAKTPEAESWKVELTELFEKAGIKTKDKPVTNATATEAPAKAKGKK